MLRISPSEWDVMRLLWSMSPLSADAVVERLSSGRTKSTKTVRTFINRLVQKGAIGFSKKGRKHYYYPLIAESTCVKAESQRFLQRVFGGDRMRMLSVLLKETNPTPDEVEELKRVISSCGR